MVLARGLGEVDAEASELLARLVLDAVCAVLNNVDFDRAYHKDYYYAGYYYADETRAGRKKSAKKGVKVG